MSGIWKRIAARFVSSRAAWRDGAAAEFPDPMLDPSDEPDHYAANRPGTAKTLIIEGWRFLPHSYAIVNQWQLLAFAPRNDVALKVRDVPFLRQRWHAETGLFGPRRESLLRSIPAAAPDEAADATLRFAVPFDVTLSTSARTALFATSENHLLHRAQLGGEDAFRRFQAKGPPAELLLFTPSRWSAEGFYKAGFAPDQVAIIPYGVDAGLFRPRPELRAGVRAALDLSDRDFVFLSVGAMTGNKGIDLLLRAFAEVSRTYPKARLVLKGMDPLFNSKDFLARAMQGLSSRDRSRLGQRIVYLGQSLSFARMAALYQAADVYVSPYRAEGFNMPVLEAAACGLPILCTAGGATDDFVIDAFARRIDSTLEPIEVEGMQGARLAPDLGHLIALMKSAVADHAWRRDAALAGPAHAAGSFSWDGVADRLLRRLSGEV